MSSLLGGRYELGSTLGTGGMSTVVAARDTVLDRAVAVKLFHQLALDPAAASRQTAEVRHLAQLSHPHLVTLYDAHLGGSDPAGDPPYLVMELIDGEPLSTRVAAQALLEAEVVSLGVGLAQALAYVHAAGVIHRDVKPSNILLAPNVGAKLVDFGIARIVDDPRLTATGSTMGTAAYLSPEQVTGQPLTAATDIYSLGLVFIECLTGKPCYSGPAVEAALARLTRLPEVPRHVSGSFQTLLSEMTRTEPEGRPTAEQVAVRLARLGAGAAALSVTPGEPASASGDQSTRVLPAPTAVLTTPGGYDGPPPTTPLGRAAEPRRGRRRPGRRVAVVALIAIAVLVAAVAVVHRGGSTSESRIPTTTISQQPGSARLPGDLARLHQAVGG